MSTVERYHTFRGRLADHAPSVRAVLARRPGFWKARAEIVFRLSRAI